MYKAGHQYFQNSLSFPSSPKTSVITGSCVKKLIGRITAKGNLYKNRLWLKQQFMSHKNIVTKF